MRYNTIQFKVYWQTHDDVSISRACAVDVFFFKLMRWKKRVQC